MARQGLKDRLKRKPKAKAEIEEPDDGAKPAEGLSARLSGGDGAQETPMPDVPEASAKSPAAAARGELSPDAQTQDLLRRLKRQQKVKLRQELAEAQELERRAKEMAKKVREQEKIRAEFSKHADYVRKLAPQLGLDPTRPVTTIPPLDSEDKTQVEFVTVQEARSYIRIVYDAKSNRYLYEAIEPTLTTSEKEILSFLRDTLVRTLDAKHGDDPELWEAHLVEAVERAIIDHSILVDEVSQQRLTYYIVRDFLGYGPIDVFMHDPMIEDISCDGPGIPVYIFHRQYESIRSNVVFEKDMELDGFVIRLAQRSGKHISIADPLLDATLPDTSRLQASLSREVTTRGSSFTIRKFRSDPLTPPDLIRLGTLSAEMAAFFWLAMEEGHSVLFAGGTASGKTTTLNAISQFIPPDKKVVSIEDTREINLAHENWIAGLTRQGFGGEIVAGKVSGSIDMYKLLEAALRQRPEYLLVGEVRGREALTLFQAMATGHATYSTVHADSVMSAVYRLENEPINVPRIMIQTLEAIGIQVQVRLDQRMVRRMKTIVEIAGIDPETGDLLTNTVFSWEPGADRHKFLGKSHIFEKIQEKKNISHHEVTSEWKNRTLILEWMMEHGIRHITDVSKIISEYYRRPETLLTKVRDAMRSPSAPKEVKSSGAD
jgi:archaeal flagellar protein FlaI